jgi:hypothetical protein
MCFIRKSLDYLFTQHELKWLDDIMPDSHKREKEEKKKKMLQDQEDGDVSLKAHDFSFPFDISSSVWGININVKACITNGY